MVLTLEKYWTQDLVGTNWEPVEHFEVHSAGAKPTFDKQNGFGHVNQLYTEMRAEEYLKWKSCSNKIMNCTAALTQNGYRPYRSVRAQKLVEVA